MIELDFKKVNDAAMVLRALKNSLRRKILAVIDESPGINVTELFRKLELEQPVASQHLAILRQAGIVRTVREGKSIHYSIDYDNIKKISPLVEELAVFFKGKKARTKTSSSTPSDPNQSKNKFGSSPLLLLIG
jgi:ArsR family transcriptional regulator, virulence genes transcriptional regulator